MSALDAVTGAFGYSGRRIARRLLESGRRVRTLTNSPKRAGALAGKVDVRPYRFDDAEALAESLRGVDVLYNTYWVRFNHAGFRHQEAVENTLRLFEAASRAGVRRVVHVSITNPSEDSPLEYFRGKARLERALRESGLGRAVLRPAVLFGDGDILVNNIAYMLRRLPVFGVPGSGDYRLQPIHVEDFAQLAVKAGAGAADETIDAIGPETFSFRELARTLGRIIGRPRPVVSLPPSVVAAASWALGRALGDVLLTPDEIAGLMAGLLETASPPAGRTALTEWAASNAASVGLRYHSELARRRDREKPYEDL